MSALDVELRPFLGALLNRSRLNEGEQDALLGLPFNLLQVKAKKDFVRLGQTVDHVSIVVEGVVARFGLTAEGERQITALYIPGDAPDLHTIILPSDVVPLHALSKVTILRVANTDLRAVAARYPAVTEAFWRHCSVDAAITSRWVLNGNRRDAKTRLSHLLCEMAVRYDANATANAGSGEISYLFPLTQAHLADAVGMTSVHVNRTLKALGEEGVVFFSDRTVRIPQWDRLVRCAEFDAEYLQAGIQPGDRLRIFD